jgi:hypothetical protein
MATTIPAPINSHKRARCLARLKAGQCQGTIGDELTLGNEDYPGNGENQHKSK